MLFRSISVHSTAWHTLKSCVNRLFSGAYPFTFTGSSVTCVFRWIPVHYTYSAPPVEKSEYAVTARKPQKTDCRSARWPKCRRRRGISSFPSTSSENNGKNSTVSTVHSFFWRGYLAHLRSSAPLIISQG